MPGDSLMSGLVSVGVVGGVDSSSWVVSRSFTAIMYAWAELWASTSRAALYMLLALTADGVQSMTCLTFFQKIRLAY